MDAAVLETTAHDVRMFTDKLQWLYVFVLIQSPSKTLQIHEKEEQKMNEKNDNASCLSEEPLISADQVLKGIVVVFRRDVENM